LHETIILTGLVTICLYYKPF